MVRVTVAELRTDFEHCREVWEEHGCFVVDDAIAPELLQRAEDAAWRVWTAFSSQLSGVSRRRGAKVSADADVAADAKGGRVGG